MFPVNRRQTVRSVGTSSLVVPLVKLSTIGNHSFLVPPPQTLNALPEVKTWFQRQLPCGRFSGDWRLFIQPAFLRGISRNMDLGEGVKGWGLFPSPPIGSPSPSRPLPFSFLHPPLPFPSPYLPLEVGPLNPARESGERCKLPSWVYGGAPAEIEFGSLHFSLKILHLVATILIIFSRVNWSNFKLSCQAICMH